MIELLNEARNEIVRLRKRNEILEAKSMVIEVFATALGMRNGSIGATVDIVWELSKRIDEINATGGEK